MHENLGDQYLAFQSCFTCAFIGGNGKDIGSISRLEKSYFASMRDSPGYLG